MGKCWVIRITEKIWRTGKNQARRSQEKVKCELNQYLVMIIVNSSNAKQVIALKMGDRGTDGQTAWGQ